MNKIHVVEFTSGTTAKTITGLFQWNFGQILQIKGLDLPSAVEVHFALRRSGEAIRRIGVTKDGVTEVEIPDVLFKTMMTSDYDIYAYVYVSDEEYGSTIHEIVMKVKSRPMPEDIQNNFDELMKAVNALADGKVDKNQGTENNGKFLGVVDGYLVLVDAPSGGTANAVQYVAQELTEEQQEQARANIGAANVTYDTETKTLNICLGGGTTNGLIEQIEDYVIENEIEKIVIDGVEVNLSRYAKKEETDRLSEEIEEIGAYRVNEFNKNDITLGKFPNTSIGQSINTFVNRENTFVCNQRWLVKKGDIIRWSWPYSDFAIYDKNGYLIERLGSDGLKEATIQSDNAHTMVYFGTSASVNYIDNFMFTINRELPTEYVEYGVIGIDTYNDKKTNERIDEIVNTDHIPYVVLNFDNQIASLDDNVVTLLEKYGFKGSFVGWKNPIVFMELLNRGWDIGTYDNSPDILPPSTTIDSTDETDISQYDNYVYQAQKKQSDIGIFNPTVWCCRQNKWGSALAKGVKKYGYKMARAYQTGDVYNLNYDKDFPILDSQRFYTGDLSTVNGVIDNVANKPNSIVVILAHMLVDTTEEDRGFDCLASEYESMLIHLKEKADSGLIKVITFRELYRELYPNSGYENDYNRLLKMSQFDYSV